MNILDIPKNVKKEGTVYIIDDYEEAAIRIFFEGKNTRTFLKNKGDIEIPIDPSNERVFFITIDGDQITKKQYDEY